MEISRETLFQAASKAGIPKSQIEVLWATLEKENSYASSFAKFILYFGAAVIVLAMGWFLGSSWDSLEGGALFLVSLLYALLFIGVGDRLWQRADLKIAGGIFITLAVCMVPLAIYGLESYFGVWPEQEEGKTFFSLIRSSWIFMEGGTILAGMVALRFYSFPLLTAPIFFASWLLAVDAIPHFAGMDLQENQREWITLWFGVVILAISYFLDLRKVKDYAFWGYLFGTLAFWLGLNSLVWNKGEVALFVYLIVNLLLMVTSIFFKRKVFMVFGASGVFIYFGHLAYEVFKDSLLFPLVMSLIGLFIIYLAILYQKQAASIEKKIVAAVPSWMKGFLPPDHQG